MTPICEISNITISNICLKQNWDKAPSQIINQTNDNVYVNPTFRNREGLQLQTSDNSIYCVAGPRDCVSDPEI